MNRDRIEGGIRNLRGRAKTAVGAVAGRPMPQVEGAIDQAAGAAQYGYGRARETARAWRRDGEDFIETASERGHAIADDLGERGRHYRDRARHHGRAVAVRAEENKAATLALVAVAAFAFGWLSRRSH
ncbi:CsbD family protein [Methylobacterium sp. A54F]